MTRGSGATSVKRTPVLTVQARKALAFGELSLYGLGFPEDEYRGREPFQSCDSA